MENKKHAWRLLPLLQGILPYNKNQLAPDILAGITLAALGIPEVMGYTKIINLPVVTGLYTVLIPMLVFGLFGSSKHLVVGADSATAAIVAASLVAFALPANKQYFELAKLVALITGFMLLLARIFRFGFIADFMSRTVLVGFLTGVGFQVAFGELPHTLGIPKSGHGFINQLLYTFQHLSNTDWTSLIISVITIGIIVGFEKFFPKFPGALVVVVGMIVASAGWHWGNHGVSLIGEVPSGLPKLSFIPDVHSADILNVLPVCFSCFVVVLAQSAATSRAYAIRYRESFSENLDLVGLSFANIAASCSSAFVVNGSPTKTAMVDSAGGKTQVSQLTTVAMVMLVLLFLTKPLSFLPNAVLASIVLLIGVKLIDVSGLREIYKVRPREFALAAITALTVIFIGVEQGILLAIVLSLLQQVRRSYQPHTGIIMHDATEQWRMEKVAPNEMIEPGLIMYWFGAELFYANANHFSEEIRKLVNETNPKLNWLVIDASALTNIDYSAGRMLRDLQQDLSKQNVVLAFARVDNSLLNEFDRMELTKCIGREYLFFSRSSCILAYRSRDLTGN
jgi:high affinity sulfate transporter 1